MAHILGKVTLALAGRGHQNVKMTLQEAQEGVLNEHGVLRCR